MKVEIHTLRYGSPRWLVECAATLDAWTGRHGYPLRIWTEKDDKPGYPCLKFCMTEMWKTFAEGDSDWMVYIDGDIYVHPDAPKMEFLGDETKVLMPKSPKKSSKGFRFWYYSAYRNRRVAIPRSWWMRNAGWMAINRASVEKLLEMVRKPYHSGTQDEWQVNSWLMEAHVKRGLQVKSPPKIWHRFYWLSAPGWMWHLARMADKNDKLETVKRKIAA